jgi:hypothetical protein
LLLAGPKLRPVEKLENLLLTADYKALQFGGEWRVATYSG